MYTKSIFFASLKRTEKSAPYFEKLKFLLCPLFWHVPQNPAVRYKVKTQLATSDTSMQSKNLTHFRCRGQQLYGLDRPT
jgi:hypothetical protein